MLIWFACTRICTIQYTELPSGSKDLKVSLKSVLPPRFPYNIYISIQFSQQILIIMLMLTLPWEPFKARPPKGHQGALGKNFPACDDAYTKVHVSLARSRFIHSVLLSLSCLLLCVWNCIHVAGVVKGINSWWARICPHFRKRRGQRKDECVDVCLARHFTLTLWCHCISKRH